MKVCLLFKKETVAWNPKDALLSITIFIVITPFTFREDIPTTGAGWSGCTMLSHYSNSNVSLVLYYESSNANIQRCLEEEPSEDNIGPLGLLWDPSSHVITKLYYPDHPICTFGPSNFSHKHNLKHFNLIIHPSIHPSFSFSFEQIHLLFFNLCLSLSNNNFVDWQW